MDFGLSSLITLAILVFSVIIHEVTHGVVAGWFGDDTAQRAGRITLNPIPHIDLMGSIIVPLLLLVSGSPVIFGAAKPVPVDFRNMRRERLGMAAVSFGGPLSNFLLAILFGLILKYAGSQYLSEALLIKAIVLNLALGTLNLIPIPPLDGSKVVLSILPQRWWYVIGSYERYGFVLVFLFILMGWLNSLFIPVVNTFFRLMGLV
jgi:Zn-dependent protease